MSWLLPICQLLLSLMEKLIASCKMVALPNIAFYWIFPTATQKEHQDRSWHTRTQISHFPKKKQFLHMLESELYITLCCLQPALGSTHHTTFFFTIYICISRYTIVYRDIQWEMFFKKFESGSVLTYQITNGTFPPKKTILGWPQPFIWWIDHSHSI